MSQKAKSLKARARNFPHQSGVYLFKNSADRIIYVGKAKNLRKRVVAYFRDYETDAKILGIREHAAILDFIVTHNELEAFLLENSLIKKHRPRYNIVLRDDKQYPYLKITLGEKWPRLLLVRRVENDGARYFGPYTGKTARRLLALVKRVFPIRWCKTSPLKSKKKPCLQFHMKNCLAPCISNVTHADYLQLCKGVVSLLSGKIEKYIGETEKRMQKASARKKYEKAARLRDTLFSLKKVAMQQKVVMPKPRNVDVFAGHQGKDGSVILLLKIRGGKLLDKETYRPRVVAGMGLAEIMQQSLIQYYSAATDLPAEVVVPLVLPEKRLVEKAISRQNRKVKIIVPTRGINLQLQEMAQQNLLQSVLVGGDQTKVAALSELQKSLKMQSLPLRIEAFDVSNLQATNLVAAMVTFENGKPKKEHYRKFKIKTMRGPDDVQAIREVVFRRYAGSLTKTLPLPNLILIDGGRGQLNAARASLLAAGLEHLRVVALAKKEEAVFTPEAAQPLRLDRRAKALLLLQKIRDEAHRFAIKYHRGKRSVFT